MTEQAQHRTRCVVAVIILLALAGALAYGWLGLTLPAWMLWLGQIFWAGAAANVAFSCWFNRP
jgi:hypothetical protein